MHRFFLALILMAPASSMAGEQARHDREPAAASTTSALRQERLGDESLFGHKGRPVLQVYGTDAEPGNFAPGESLSQLVRFVQSAQGDNRSFVGGNTLYVEARDRGGVTSRNKGVLYPIYATISPVVARDNVPYDDANGVSVMNITGVKGANGTDAFYLGHNSAGFGDRLTGTREWVSGMTLDANLGVGIQMTGKLDSYGVDLSQANIVSGQAFRIATGQGLYGRGTAGAADQMLIGLDRYGGIEIGRGGMASTTVYAGVEPVIRADAAGLKLGRGKSIRMGERPVISSDPAGALTLGASAEPLARAYVGTLVHATRIVRTGAVVTATRADWLIVIRKASASPTTIRLPVAEPGQSLIIKDGKGDASTHAITILPASGTIDGAPSHVIHTNRGAVRLTYDGEEWIVL